jgi:probable HAF family extracellular repeat protein
MGRYSICCVFTVAVSLAPAATAADLEANGYRLTRVGLLPPPYNAAGFAKAINDGGQLLISSGQQSNIRAAIFTPASGSLTDLGTPPAPYNYRVDGNALNDLGQAAGTAWASNLTYHAFLYSGGPSRTVTDLGALPGYGYASQALGINNVGQVVGASQSGGTAGSTAHAFVYSDNVMRDLGSLAGFNSSVATDINNAGVSVGYCFAAYGTFQPEMAFISGPSGMRPLGTLPAPYNFGSEAHAINDRGDVVGTSYDSAGNSRAFLWSNGVMTDLGTPSGFTARAVATSINDSGQIMGRSSAPNGGTHYFLYSDGKMTDLNSLLYTAFEGYQLQGFGPINDSGQIGADGYGPDGSYQPVLLTPVPEPGALSLIAFCGAGLLRRPRGAKQGQGT